MLVLSLLRQSKGTGHSSLDGSIGIFSQKLQVTDLHRANPAYGTHHPRHLDGIAGAPNYLPRPIRVDPIKRRGKPVGVTLAADLAVGNNIQTAALHIPDCQEGGIILSGLQKLFGNPPQALVTDTGNSTTGQRLPVD